MLLLAHTNIYGPFRVGSHHYAREFARIGIDVVHLSTPVSFAHRVTGRVSSAELDAVPRGAHRDDFGVVHVVPRTVLPRPYGRFRVDRELARQGIDPTFDAVLLDQPLLWDHSVRQLAPQLIYRPTDTYPDGIKARLQEQVVAQADAVVATSDEVLTSLGALSVPTLVLENGVDARHFAASSPHASPREDICVYVGALDSRLDWAQLIGWATGLPSTRFVVAGPAAPSTPPGLPANISLVGAVDYANLPALLRSARVGMLPLSDNPGNAGRSPMKLHEYLAAELSVVARRTPVIGPDESAGVFTYNDATDADAALTRALSYPSPNMAGAKRAAAETWEVKTRAFLDFLADLNRPR
ncbi:glycosyltransferase [Microbacterium sp. NPDC076895]|uniref:glycosyltransferase n=1 Tax=Microbacterium sp. NPDC076895 TaxID=3154957 RepID=UPI00344469D0